MSFGFCATEFLAAAAEVNAPSGRPTLAHFHEWMAGVALPRIAHARVPVQMVFTTHATLLGRYLAGDDPEFYGRLPHYDADREADRYTIGPRHRIEKAAAHSATVFTTVSDVTRREAEHLLGRDPEVLVPNGLDVERFEAPHEFHHLHSQYKREIHNFVRGHFFASAPFDLDKTLYLFTSGRYEYKNKGIDLFIEGLWRLNQAAAVGQGRRRRGGADGRRVHHHPRAGAERERRDVVEPGAARRAAADVRRAQGADRRPAVRGGQPRAHGRPGRPDRRGGRDQAQAGDQRRPRAAVPQRRDARLGRRRRRPGAAAPAAPRPHQRPRRPGEGRLPPAVRHEHQPADLARLRPVRPRVPHGRLPLVLRAVGLHADGVHGHGPAERDDGLGGVRQLLPARCPRATSARPATSRTSPACW